VASAAADVQNLLEANVAITVPTLASYQVAAGDTLRSVTDSSQLTLGQVAEAIAPVTGLIAAGVTITIPAGHTVAADDTFASVADVFGISPAALGNANSLTPKVLATGARLALPVGATTPVKYDDTLQSVAERAGVLATLLGEANGDNSGLLIVGDKITVNSTTHEIEAGDTLATIAAQLKISIVALVGAIVGDKVIQPGSAAALPRGARYLVAEDDTLDSIASSHGTGAGDLATANASAQTLLAAGAVLTAEYVTKRGDTFQSVAKAFTLTVAKLAAANPAVANLFPPESALNLADKDYAIGTGDTFESISKQEQISVSDIGVTNPDSKVFEPGKSLNIPSHVAMGDTVDSTYQVKQGDTFTTVQTATTVTVRSLALANQDLAGLIAPSVELTYTISQRSQSFSVTTVANDTLSTVTARLQAALTEWQEAQEGRPRIAVTAGDLAQQNAGQAGLLVAGQLMLVPPADMTQEVEVPATVADYPRVVFPVTASLTIERPAADIDPRFHGVPGIGSVTTLLRPNIAPDAVQSGATESGVQRFAKAFQAAYPNLKLASGSERGSADNGAGSQNRLFAVQHDTADFSYDIVGDRPYFFAPPPLLNSLWHSDGTIPIRPYVSGQGLRTAVDKTLRCCRPTTPWRPTASTRTPTRA
jgi:LysM repeat protein